MVGEQRARAVQPARSEEVPLSLRLGERMADKMTTGSRDGGGFLDLNYGRSFAGILKAVQAIVIFIAFLCITCSDWTHYATFRYFEVVTIWFFIMVLVFYIIYLTRLHQKMTCINWPLTEFLHYVIATILILVASIIGASKAFGYAGLAAGVFFGFASTILYGVGAWQSYKMWRVPQPSTVTV